MDNITKTLKYLPHTPGIYLFRDKAGNIIYVGKARDLSSRIHSYFSPPHHVGEKTRQLVKNIKTISVKQVATEFEALLLEAKYIRQYAPKYNIVAKDDTSPIYIHIQPLRDMPIILLSRKPKGSKAPPSDYFGPFGSKKIARLLLRTVRHSIPFCQEKRRNGKPCFYTHLGLCNPCPSSIEKMPEGNSKNELVSLYNRNISRIRWILSGHSKKTIRSLENEMLSLSSKKEFENAAIVRDHVRTLLLLLNNRFDPFTFDVLDTLERAPDEQIKSLRLFLRNYIPTIKSLFRIECFDISTIQGTATVGSMVVFEKGLPHTDLYRKFKTKNENLHSDTDSMTDVIRRRLAHMEWPYPDLILVDGGKPQVSATAELLKSLSISLPVVGLAKRFEQIVLSHKNTFKTLTVPLSSPALQLLQHIRDEAHRFAISYHRKVRARLTLPETPLI